MPGTLLLADGRDIPLALISSDGRQSGCRPNTSLCLPRGDQLRYNAVVAIGLDAFLNLGLSWTGLAASMLGVASMLEPTPSQQ